LSSVERNKLELAFVKRCSSGFTVEPEAMRFSLILLYILLKFRIMKQLMSVPEHWLTLKQVELYFAAISSTAKFISRSVPRSSLGQLANKAEFSKKKKFKAPPWLPCQLTNTRNHECCQYKAMWCMDMWETNALCLPFKLWA